MSTKEITAKKFNDQLMRESTNETKYINPSMHIYSPVFGDPILLFTPFWKFYLDKVVENHLQMVDEFFDLQFLWHMVVPEFEQTPEQKLSLHFILSVSHYGLEKKWWLISHLSRGAWADDLYLFFCWIFIPVVTLFSNKIFYIIIQVQSQMSCGY